MTKKEPINFKTLATIPIDVRKILLREQAKDKEKRGIAKYSIQLTVCRIIREWNNKCAEK